MTRAHPAVSRSARPQWLAIAVDAVFLVAGLLLLYTALGGEVRWKTSLFRITLTEPNRPTQICVLALLAKVVLGLQRGLFASLATIPFPVVAPVAAFMRAIDLRLRALFLAYRLPLLVSVASLFVALGVLEWHLRHFPFAWPRALANHVATGYHTGPSGIYRSVPELRTILMRPNHEQIMYFNGYRWHHKTDSRGFRNPVERASAAVVLSGDSIVYGHGVEEISTVRHHLEVLLGEPVVNLGQQGSSIHDEYQVLKTFGIGLHPRYVFLFFLANDLDDLGRLTDGEMTAFLGIPVDDHHTPYFEVKAPRRHRWYVEWSRVIESHLEDLYIVKAWDFLRRSGRARWGAAAEASDDVPSSLPAGPGGSTATLAMRFHLHALQKIQNLADRNGFAFVNVFTYTGRIADEPVYEKTLAAFCQMHDIAFLSLRPAFERALRNHTEVFLEEDGHLSDAGARLAAEVLARYVNQQPTPSSGR